MTLTEHTILTYLLNAVRTGNIKQGKILQLLRIANKLEKNTSTYSFFLRRLAWANLHNQQYFLIEANNIYKEIA